jgi:hypothetical protein
MGRRAQEGDLATGGMSGSGRCLLCALAPLLLTAGAWAQPAKCTLGVDQSPTVRGFQLGMTKEQAVASFGEAPGTYVRNERDDTAVMSVAEFQFPEKLKKVTTITMNLFDNRIHQMTVSYGSGAFDSIAQAQEVFAREWKLPAAAWSKVQYGDTSLYCKDWVVTLRLLGGRPQVELGIIGMQDRIKAREKQKAGAGFKP